MVLLAPIFKSASLTQPEYGYGVTQFDDVEPQLGSLSDFDKLIETAKKNGEALHISWLYIIYLVSKFI